MANDKSYTIPKATQSPLSPPLTMRQYLLEIRHSEVFKKQLKLLLPELSARESQVAFFYAFGLSTPDLASFLSISHETVRTHLQKAKSKFGVSKTFEIRLIFLMRLSSYIFVADLRIPI